MAPRNQKSRKETSKRIILRIPALATASSSSAKSKITESSLRKLARADLQKLARENGIRANVKSEIIIRDLLKIQPANKESTTTEDGPAKKKAKTAEDPPAQLPPTPESETIALTDDTTKRLYEALSGAFQQPATEPQDDYQMEDDDLYSASESEGSHVTQPDYATPVSSRSGTPERSSIVQLERCVTVMQEISEKDQAMIAQIAKLREKAAKLRKQTQDIRDVVRAEQGRRERMEAFFAYWTEIEDGWHRKWLWGEAMIPPKYLIPQGGDDVTGPPTVVVRRREPPTAVVPAETAAPPAQEGQENSDVITNQRNERTQEEVHRPQSTGDTEYNQQGSQQQDSEMAGDSSLSRLPSPHASSLRIQPVRGTKRKHCS